MPPGTWLGLCFPLWPIILGSSGHDLPILCDLDTCDVKYYGRNEPGRISIHKAWIKIYTPLVHAHPTIISISSHEFWLSMLLLLVKHMFTG